MTTLARCQMCHSESIFISDSLGVCLTCIRERPEDAMPVAASVHEKTREGLRRPQDRVLIINCRIRIINN